MYAESGRRDRSRYQLFHRLCRSLVGQHPGFEQRLRNAELRREDALEYRAEIRGGVRVAVVIELAAADTGPSTRDPPAPQRAAREEHGTAGAMVGAAGAVDVRGAAEFSGDDHDGAIPRRPDRSLERVQSVIEFGDLARHDRCLVGVGIPTVVLDEG